MSNGYSPGQITRRQLLASTAIGLLMGASAAQGRTISQAMPWQPGTATPPLQVRAGPWMFFTAEEAALVEGVVDRLIPADELGPGGKEAGCALFIDRQLAGPYGRGDGLYLRPPFMPGTATQGYQSPDAPAARYRKGLRAMNEHVKAAFAGQSFVALSVQDQDRILTGLESGSLSLAGIDGAQFFALLLQNTQEGFFADPVYGGNHDMIGWKLVGFPGARYDYREWVERHNEPYSLAPVSIMGRSDWTIQE
jgi:gluconate 2-dehydrogenase gamma chain